MPNAKYYAEFKTAYLQREIPMTIDVIGDLHVGQLVRLVPNDKAPYIEGVGTYTEGGTSVATHIIAQSDMTLGYGHVPVENRDYRYNDVVHQTVGTAPSPQVESTTSKMVALFEITDPDDLIITEKYT